MGDASIDPGSPSGKAGLFLSAMDFYSCFKEPDTAQQAFSSEINPTMAKVYPVLEFLQIHLKNLVQMPCFASLKISIQAGFDVLAKYSSLVSLVDANTVCLGGLLYLNFCDPLH
jgi:hypothetical protein